jgi:hypothetical protein
MLTTFEYRQNTGQVAYAVKGDLKNKIGHSASVL